MRYLEIIEDTDGVRPSGRSKSKAVLPPLRIDNREGMGAVPDCANIDYMGVKVMMTPSQFLRLAVARDFNAHSNLVGIIRKMKKGVAIGSPFLDVDFGDGSGETVPAVKQHEGRTRMEAIRQLYGEVPVEVHLFPRGGLRARHIKPEAVERFRLEAIPEKTKTVLPGPHFIEAISHRA